MEQRGRGGDGFRNPPLTFAARPCRLSRYRVTVVFNGEVYSKNMSLLLAKCNGAKYGKLEVPQRQHHYIARGLSDIAKIRILRCATC